jgi:alcohol dehydrogenase (NADP+)
MTSEGSPTKKQKTEQSTKMASAPEQFQGFMIHSKEKWSDFTKEKVR